MMRNTSIIYFGNDWFGENRTSSHHIARRLGKRFPLLYVEVPGLRAPKADARDLRKMCRKIAKAVQPPRQIGLHMWHMTVPQIPFRGLPLVGAVNRYAGVQLVKSAMKQIGMESPLLWFTVPHPGHFLGHLGEAFGVYYCIDNYASLPDVNQDQVAWLDDDLTRRADLVFVCSSALLESRKRLNPNTIYSPHGVDTDLFRRAQADLPPVEAIRNLPRPIIGLHGLVDDRLDLELVTEIARHRPDWTLLLVGRVATDVSALRQLSNVVFTGAVPYETLPDWARAYDAAIMPYRPGPFAENANPLKLREYLACGKPLVSVPMPAVDTFRQYVPTASNPTDFVACIERALLTDSPEARKARMNAVQHMSWDARVEEVLTTVEQYCEKKTQALHSIH